MQGNNQLIQGRGAARSQTRIYATVRYYSETATGRVVDLSATGMAIDLGGPFHAADGSKVRIDSAELGVLEGQVKWRRGSRLGIQLQLNSNALAQVSSYFRFFHQEIRPVLTR